MTWRIRHSIAKRRGRAMVASILAVLFLVLAPTAGAAIVSGINSKLPQVSLLELDDQITDADIIFDDVRNGSTITWNGGNYSTDIQGVNWVYGVNGSYVHEPLSYSITDDGKIFAIITESQTADSAPKRHLKLYTYITPSQLNDARVSKLRIYFSDGYDEENLRVSLVVKDLLVDGWYSLGYANFSANGSWAEFEIPELTRLEIASKHTDASSFLYIALVRDSGSLSAIPGDSFILDVQLIGPESGGVAKNWLNYYFLLGGLVGLVGAVFATPYVNIRSFRKAKHKHTKQFRRNKRKRSFRRRRRR